MGYLGPIAFISQDLFEFGESDRQPMENLKRSCCNKQLMILD